MHPAVERRGGGCGNVTPRRTRWLNADGTATAACVAAREQIEAETDEHCAALWTPIGDTDVRRLTSLIMPIHDAFTAARTYPFRVEMGDTQSAA